MKFVSNGKSIELPPRGPAGPDGSPIGTIISYMGKTAPKDYLVCDGSVYALSDYPELARFFTKQFGSSNYFGGDGVATFAVPDMRNLFLRGYHGEAEEQLSGEIGTRQEATRIPYTRLGYNQIVAASINGEWNSPENTDEIGGEQTYDSYGRTTYEYYTMPFYYTSRPVNMAILYCIKAVESFQAQDIYSEEERRVGTWIDGKPVYRRAKVVKNDGKTHVFANDVDAVISTIGTGVNSDNKTLIMLPYYVSNTNGLTWTLNGGELTLKIGGFSGYTLVITVEYTKTTDQAAIEPAAAIQGGISL